MKKFFASFWDKIDDFVLELLRVAVIAIIPVAIVSLEKGELDWKAIGITAFIAIFRAIDRWLHEKEIVEKGLLPF